MIGLQPAVLHADEGDMGALRGVIRRLGARPRIVRHSLAIGVIASVALGTSAPAVASPSAGVDNWATEAFVAAVSRLLGAYLLVLLAIWIVTFARDGAARRRLAARFSRRNRRTPCLRFEERGMACVDVSAEATRRLWRSRLSSLIWALQWPFVVIVVIGILTLVAPPADLSGSLRVLAIGAGGMVLLGFGGRLADRLMRRKSRHEGQTVFGDQTAADYRSLFRGAGRGAVVVGAAGLLVFILGGVVLMVAGGLSTMLASYLSLTAAASQKWESFSLAAMLMGIALLAATTLPERYLAGRKQRRLGRALAQDPRAPVVLLRSFQDDRLRLRVHRSSRSTFVDRLGFRMFDRFEDVVCWRLWLHGRVIAIGEPGVAPPERGALRLFESQDGWMNDVHDAAQHARLIALVVGPTDGVRWEIYQLRALGRLDSTLFIIPPVRPGEAQQRIALLGATLGVSLAIPDDGRRDEPAVLAITFSDDLRPTYFCGSFRDDVSYSAAIDAAATQLLARPAPTPVAVATDAQRPPRVEMQPGKRRRRIARRVWPWAAALVGVWGTFVLVGSFGDAMLETLKDPRLQYRITLPTEFGETTVTTQRDNIAIADHDEGYVAIVDRSSLTDASFYRLGRRADDAEWAGTRLFLADSADGSVTVLDPKTARYRKEDVAPGAQDIEADAEAVFVTCAEAKCIARLDPVRAKVLERWHLEAEPWASAAVADELWVTLPAIGSVVILDAASGEVRETLDGLGHPRSIDASGSHVYVHDPESGRLTIIDARTRHGMWYRLKRGAVAMAPTDDGVLLANAQTGVLLLVENDGAMRYAAMCGSSPTSVALDGDRVLVSRASAHDVLVVPWP